MSRPLLPTELWAQTDAVEGCEKPHEAEGTLAFCQTAINRPMIVFAVMTRRWTEVARALVVVASCVAAMASASSSQNTPPAPNSAAYSMSPPQPQWMQPASALGLWMSSFGAVKIEEDLSRGPAGSGQVHGVWTYQDRNTQREVVGYFTGALRGNVLEFRWQEPSAQQPLVGYGFLAFEPTGRSFRGRWRTDSGDRIGDWDGWRDNGSSVGAPPPQPQQPYPQQPTGQPTGQPYPQQPYGQPYPQQPQPYGQPQQPTYQPQPTPFPSQQQPYAQPPAAPPAQPRYY